MGKELRFGIPLITPTAEWMVRAKEYLPSRSVTGERVTYSYIHQSLLDFVGKHGNDLDEHLIFTSSCHRALEVLEIIVGENEYYEVGTATMEQRFKRTIGGNSSNHPIKVSLDYLNLVATFLVWEKNQRTSIEWVNFYSFSRYHLFFEDEEISLFLSEGTTIEQLKPEYYKKQSKSVEVEQNITVPFVSISEVIEQLSNTYAFFPEPEYFYKFQLTHDIAEFEKCYSSLKTKNRPILLMQRWASGKTVFALLFGLWLERKCNESVTYLDFLTIKPSEGHDAGYIQSCLRQLKQLSRQGVVILLDNIHCYRKLAYDVVQYCITNSISIVCLSRPVSESFSGINDYYPGLFDHVYGELIELPSLPTPLEIAKNLLTTRVKELKGDETAIGPEQIEQLLTDVRGNLIVMSYHVKLADSIEQLLKVSFRKIYDFIETIFDKAHLSEITTIASINYFDQPAYLIPDSEQEKRRLDNLTQRVLEPLDSEARVLQTNRAQYSLLGRIRYTEGGFGGIQAGEARLILEAASRTKLKNYSSSERTRVFYDALSEEVQRYFKVIPPNAIDLVIAIYSNKQSDEEQIGNEKYIMLLKLLENERLADYFRTNIFLNASVSQVTTFLKIARSLHVSQRVRSRFISRELLLRHIEASRNTSKTFNSNFLQELIYLDETLARLYLRKVTPSVIHASCLSSLKSFNKNTNYLTKFGLLDQYLGGVKEELLRNCLLSELSRYKDYGSYFNPKIFIQLTRKYVCHTKQSYTEAYCRVLQPFRLWVLMNRVFGEYPDELNQLIIDHFPKQYKKLFFKYDTIENAKERLAKKKLKDIKTDGSYPLWQWYLNTHFQSALAKLSIGEVQQVLGNITKREFSIRSKTETVKSLKSKKNLTLIEKHIRSQQQRVSYRDIAYLIYNAYLLDIRLCKLYCNIFILGFKPQLVKSDEIENFYHLTRFLRMMIGLRGVQELFSLEFVRVMYLEQPPRMNRTVFSYFVLIAYVLEYDFKDVTHSMVEDYSSKVLTNLVKVSRELTGREQTLYYKVRFTKLYHIAIYINAHYSFNFSSQIELDEIPFEVRTFVERQVSWLKSDRIRNKAPYVIIEECDKAINIINR